MQRDLASMKEANIRLEAEIQRYREKEMKTNFEKNEKEYNYLLKLI